MRTTPAQPPLRSLSLTALLCLALLLAACRSEPAPPTAAATRPAIATWAGPATSAVATTAAVEASPVAEITPTFEATAEVPATPVAEATRLVTATAPPPTPTPRPLLNPEVSGEVRFWHFWDEPAQRSAMARVIALCQQQLPKLDIIEEVHPWNQIWRENIAAVAAGSGMPDVIVEDRPQLPQRARDGVLQSLQPYIARDGFAAAAFWPFAWQETLYQGESYGLPHESDLRLLYWNRQALVEAGLDPAQPPRRWEDLWALAGALDRRGPEGELQRVAFFPLWQAPTHVWALSNGWQPVVDGRPNYDDPAYIGTLSWIKQWVDRYGGWQPLQDFRARFTTAPNDLFMSGAVALVVDGPAYLMRLPPAEGSASPLEWGVGPLPYNRQPANFSRGYALAMPRGAAHPDAAWEFIKCATALPAQTAWARDTLGLPSRREAAAAPELMAIDGWPAIGESLPHSHGAAYIPAYPNYQREVGFREEQVWQGILSPEEAARQIQAAIDAVIAQNSP